MAKPIPKAKVKKKIAPKAKKKNDRRLKEFIAGMVERSEIRQAWVDGILSVNSNAVRAVVEQMVDNLQKMEGPPKFVFDDRTYTAVDGSTAVLEQIQERNFRYLAMRCLVACAEWDIRIADFSLPNDTCARCGVVVKKVKKKAKKKVAS